MRAEYVLLDMDKDALLESKARLAGFDAEFVLADAQKLPFRRGVFT
jgi:ubiquinone/menaquinone biosynthesis C-methylase UbiE